jgi:hypothetical protein
MIKNFAIVGSAKPTINSGNEFSELSKYLQGFGMVETSIEDSDGLIFINYNRKSYKQYMKLGKSLKNLVLIRLEPYGVFPLQYHSSITDKFGLIIDPGKKNRTSSRSDFIGWPYKYHLNPSTPSPHDPDLKNSINNAITNEFYNFQNWKLKQDKIVLIAANKVSPTSNSNYKLRRRIAKQMPAHYLDTYGPLWNASLVSKLLHRVSVGLNALKGGFIPNLLEIYGDLHWKYPTYVGEPTDKHHIIQQYRYSLVVENSSDYCSEKLFDVVINGSIPIYVGPKNSNLNLPNGLYFSCDGSLGNLKSLLNSIRDEDIIVMLTVMRDFIQSENFFTDWTSDKVYENIAHQIDNYWNQK